jgi:threonine dehydrogenase-like Zn-dependent dehydrogenase
MKAAVLKKVKEPLVIEDVPIPVAGPKEILMKVKQCGICITDIRMVSGVRPTGNLPFIIGHEGVGIVEEIGKEVTKFRKGDRVLINPMLSCGMCLNCSDGRDNMCESRKLIGITNGAPGVFAEYGVIPERNLYKLPDEVSFTDGVLINSVLSPAFHGVKRINFKASETTCVYGLGSLGTMVLLTLKAFGASQIIGIDINEQSLKNAEKFGIDYLINSKKEDPVKKIRELTGGRGVDVAFEVVGNHETILQAIYSTRHGGKTCILGVPFYHVVMDFKDDLGFFHEMSEKETSMIVAWGYTRQEFPMMLNMVKKGLIDFSPCRTKVISLKEVNEGLKLTQAGEFTRVIIEM